MKNNIIRLAILLAFIGFVTLAIRNVISTDNKIQLRDIQIKDSSVQLKQLRLKYDVLDKNLDNELNQKNKNQDNIKKLEEDRTRLQQELNQAKSDLQAKLDAKNTARQFANAVTGTRIAYAQPTSDGSAKMFIYTHESGNNPSSVNEIGACGLGQALPCSKMPCALGDYTCQDNWFTNSYMVPRYGTWEAAKSFWMSHGHPCNNDVGWCGWW